MATRYWVGGTGNWSSTTKWSATSGGASGASVPTSTDDVVFNASSGTAGFVATVNSAQTCASLTLTPDATIGITTIAITVSLTVTGAFSMSGTAGNQRFLIRGTSLPMSTDFSVGSASGLSDLDFRDVRVIGAGAPLSGTRIGNFGGVTGVTFSAAKTVYWNLAGAQNWSANGWAATSGGTPATSNFPLAQDTAVFDNTGSVTGTITMSAAIPHISGVDMSARTSAMTLATTAVTVYGDWKNGSGTTLSGSAALTFSGRNTQTITSASKNFTQVVTIDTYGGTVQLADALSASATSLTITNGTFTTNGFNVTSISLSSSNSNVRAINLGASTVTLSSSASVSFASSTNLTFNAGTSTINLTNTAGATFNGGGKTFYTVNFSGVPSTSGIVSTFDGSNIFTNLSFTPTSGAGITIVSLPANLTITGTLTCAGASAVRRIFLRSDTLGTQRTLTCGTVSANDCDFRDIIISGTTPAPTRAGDCGGNSGITFPAGKTVYWNLAGAQNWSATGWASTSGGSPAITNFPLAQDTAVFNNTGSVTGTITMDAAWNMGSFDSSTRTSAMTLSTSTLTVNVYGNWTFGTGVTSSFVGGTYMFSGRGTKTITCNGGGFGCAVTVNSPSGVVQLADALALTGGSKLSVSLGTFDAATFDVGIPGFSMFPTSSNSTALKMGSGTWTLTGTGSVWDIGGGFVFSIIKGSANIVLSNTSTTARSFLDNTGVATAYNKLTIGGTTSTSTLTITGFGISFTEIDSTKTVAHTIDFGTTSYTVGAWTVTGTSGNIVTVSGTATLTIAGARVSGVDYLALGTTTLSSTSPGEFYAGANSTGGTGFILTAAPTPTTRYWVGGTGTWDATTTTNWSATSGGSGGASVPTSADDVVFNSSSNATAYTVTATATQLRCAALTMAGPLVGNITFAGNAPIAFHGNVSLPATGLTWTYAGNFALSGSATGKTFTTNGASVQAYISVNGVGCGWSLGSALNTAGLDVLNGSFNTANYALTCSYVAGNQSNSISISFGSSTVSLQTFFDLSSNSGFAPANLTFNAGTSSITFSQGAVFWGYGYTFYNVSFAQQSSIQGANTFNNLTINKPVGAEILPFYLYANQTVTGTLALPAGTNATYRTFLQSDTLGTARILTVGALAAGAADVDFCDITVSGAAAPISGTRFGDCKGNSGITFGAGVNKYWNRAAGGNWSAVGWATTSGGTPAVNNLPLAQDTAWIESTGLTSGNTITVDAAWNIGTINMSGRTTNTMTLATASTDFSTYGNWINGTGTTLTGNGNLIFSGRGSQTLTSAGRTFSQRILMNSPGGSLTLQDALSNSFTGGVSLGLAQGTFDANVYNVTLSGAAGSVDLSYGGSTGTRTMAIGSGTWSLAGSGTTWSAGSTTNLTVTGTGTVSLTSASAKTFSGGSFAYTNITLNQGGAGTLNITGNNTFKNITNSYGVTGATTIAFGNGSTTTLSQFTAAGTAGNLLLITGPSNILPVNLILTSGTVSSDYLSILGIKAYATTSTWYAGTNSTNSGTLGWFFTAGPSVGGTSNFFMLF
jgi:hypothetical protein